MKKKKKHAPLQDSVRGRIREISVAMFFQIRRDIYSHQGHPQKNASNISRRLSPCSGKYSST